MALGGVGHWHEQHWHTQHWHEEHWAESVAIVPGVGGDDSDWLLLLHGELYLLLFMLSRWLWL